MTDQAKEEYLIPGVKNMFDSALERKIELFTKRARHYLRLVFKSEGQGQGLHYEMLPMTLTKPVYNIFIFKTLLENRDKLVRL